MPTTRYLSMQKAHPSYQQQVSDTKGQPTDPETMVDGGEFYEKVIPSRRNGLRASKPEIMYRSTRQL